MRRRKQNLNGVGYSLIAPWLIGLLAFTIIPVIASLYLSFTKYDLLSPPHWFGLGNYTRMMFGDELFWQSVRATIVYVFTSVPLRLAFALFIASLLAKKHRFIGAYRTVYYLPSLLGESVAIAVLWRQIFGDHGAIDALVRGLGVTPDFSWVGNPVTAIWTLVLLSAWQFGSSMLIFLAGMKNIPDSYYEAAIVDGAGAWTKFTRITIPLLTPIILFNLIMQLIAGFKTFTQSFIITQGGPLNTTLFYSVYLYQRGFVYSEMGYASGMAWVLLVVVGIMTALIFKSSAWWVYYESK
jgi:pectin-derived oligosaccharide transport system permease protein